MNPLRRIVFSAALSLGLMNASIASPDTDWPKKPIQMKHLFSLLFLFTLSILSAQSVQSPSGKITVNFKLGSNGQPVYAVNYKNKAVVLESALGIKLKEKPALDANFEILDSKTATFNESWKPVLGEQSSIVNHHH